MLKRKNLTFLSLLFVAAALMFSAADVNAQSKRDIRDAKKLYDNANRDFQRKNYREAIEKYAESLALAPQPETYFWKGYAHYYLKESDSALFEFNNALERGFKPSEVYKVRWFVNYELKNFDAALADVEKALEAEPNDFLLLRAAGDIHFQRNEFPQALAYYERATKFANNDGNLHYNMARIYFQLMRTDEQLASAQAAVRANTQWLGDSWFLIGDAFEKRKDIPKAIDAYERALASKPDIYAAYRSLADIYRSQNRLQDAIEISRKALRQFPRDGNIYTDIGWYYSLAGMHQEAVEASKAAIMILPNQYIAYTNLCRAYNDLRDPEKARAACNNALRLSPNDGETNFYLGYSYMLENKQAEARRYYIKAIPGLVDFTKKNPEYSDGYYLLGNAYLGADQLDNAMKAYEKCLELSPAFAKARHNLGVIQIRKGNKSGAMEQYNHLAAVDPDLAKSLKSQIDAM